MMSTNPLTPGSSDLPAINMPPTCISSAPFCICIPLSPVPKNCLTISLYALTRLTASLPMDDVSGLLVAPSVAALAPPWLSPVPALSDFNCSSSFSNFLFPLSFLSGRGIIFGCLITRGGPPSCSIPLLNFKGEVSS